MIDLNLIIVLATILILLLAYLVLRLFRTYDTKIIYSPARIFIRFDFVQLVGSDVFATVLDVMYDPVSSKRIYLVELFNAEESPKVYPYYGRYRFVVAEEIVAVAYIHGDF